MSKKRVLRISREAPELTQIEGWLQQKGISEVAVPTGDAGNPQWVFLSVNMLITGWGLPDSPQLFRFIWPENRTIFVGG